VLVVWNGVHVLRVGSKDGAVDDGGSLVKGALV